MNTTMNQAEPVTRRAQSSPTVKEVRYSSLDSMGKTTRSNWAVEARIPQVLIGNLWKKGRKLHHPILLRL